MALHRSFTLSLILLLTSSSPLLADPPGSGTQAASASTAPAAVEGAAGPRVDCLRLYHQIQSLRLTADQQKAIVIPLWRALDADARYRAERDRAAATIGPLLAREETAMLAGRALSSADEDNLKTALAASEQRRIESERRRQETIETIRAILTRSQIGTLLAIEGLTIPVLAGDPGPEGPGPGGPGPGVPGAGGTDAGQDVTPPRARAGVGAVGPGGNPFSADSLAHILDHFRRMPAQDWNEAREGAARGQVAMNLNGVVVTSPEYTAANNGVSFFDQMQQMRDLSDEMYDQQKEQLAESMAQQFQAFAAAHPNPEGGMVAGGLSPAAQQLIGEAIRRFFLQPDTYRYFWSRAPR